MTLARETKEHCSVVFSVFFFFPVFKRNEHIEQDRKHSDLYDVSFPLVSVAEMMSAVNMLV